MQKIKDLLKRGDTIIEVTFAITIFSLISVITIQLMDHDVAIIQGAIETEMARNEIDAQAEALRFIHNAYLSERELASSQDETAKIEYRDLWAKLSRQSDDYISSEAGSGLANLPGNISQYLSANDCKVFYQDGNNGTLHNIYRDKAFVINTRKIDPSSIATTIIESDGGDKSKFKQASLNPRIVYTRKSSSGTNEETSLAEIGIEDLDHNTSQFKTYTQQNKALYTKIASIEGVWVIAVRDYTENNPNSVPDFYDFHIRTCWFAPGHDRPSTIGTTIRLYNPELIEAQI